jgi:hypothetical protein
MDLPLVGGGALGALVAVVFYLLKVNATDRRDYRREVMELRERLDRETARCLERVEAEVAARRVIQKLLDAEREAKRRAEDTAYIQLRENYVQLREIRKHVTPDKPVDDGPD